MTPQEILSELDALKGRLAALQDPAPRVSTLEWVTRNPEKAAAVVARVVSDATRAAVGAPSRLAPTEDDSEIAKWAASVLEMRARYVARIAGKSVDDPRPAYSHYLKIA